MNITVLHSRSLRNPALVTYSAKQNLGILRLRIRQVIIGLCDSLNVITFLKADIVKVG